MQCRPHRVATHGQAAMVVLHLGEIAISTFNRRGCPLESLGMLTSPRFPARQHLGCQLPGARMLLKGLLNCLEHVSNLGFLSWTARAESCSCQYSSGNSNSSAHCCPSRGHGYLRPSLGAPSATKSRPGPRRQQAACGPWPRWPFSPATRSFQATSRAPGAQLAIGIQPPVTSGGSHRQGAKDA